MAGYSLGKYGCILLCALILCLLTFDKCAYAQMFQQDPKGDTSTQLGCHRRRYTYRVTQTDAKGLQCWDDVSVWSCWGRCDSSEISDWKFPYKRSFHPVCVHAGRQPATAILRNCETGADQQASRYQYLEAVSCHCRTCSSMDTSCEAPSNGPVDEPTVSVLSLEGTETDDYDY